MKIFTSLLVLGVIALGAWLWWSRGSTEVALEPSPSTYVLDSTTETPTPFLTSEATPYVSPTPLGQGGAGPLPVRAPVFVAMSSTNGSGEYGVAAVLANDNDLAQVSFNLVSAPVGVYQHAYIMHGTCASLGSIAYALEPLINGSSITTLDADFLDVTRSQGSLAIVVYSPDDQVGIPYACGQLH